MRFLASILAVLALLARAHTAAAVDAATVADFEGTAEIGRAGAWSAATMGATLQPGDELRTAADGRVRLVFADESVLAVGAAAHIALSAFAFDAAQATAHTLLRLSGGKVRAIVPLKDAPAGLEHFEIETATGLARVKGTEFVITFDPVAEVTEVVGVQGQIAVHSVLNRTARGVVVTARELSIVRRGQFPTPPQTLTETLFRQYIDGLEFIGSGKAESQLLGLPLLREGALGAGDRASALPEPPRDAFAELQGRDIGTLTSQPPILRRPDLDLGPDIEALSDDPRDPASILGQPPAVFDSDGDLGVRF